MEADLKWVVGVGISLIIALATTIIGSFRNLASRITSGHSDLHGRIDKVKDDYVRRDDLDGHIRRLERSVSELREEMRINHGQIIEALTKREQ